MSFIYRAPLQFSVSAGQIDRHLHFNEDATVLLKYVDERDVSLPRNAGAEEGSLERTKHGKAKLPQLPVKAVWRRDGITPICPEWWKVCDLGPWQGKHGGQGRLGLARLEFLAKEFSRHIHDGKDAASLALYDAFLEQDTIQLDVEIEPRSVTALILKLSYH